MKIWFQSATPLGRNPIYDRYQEAFLAQVKKAARPDTEVKYSGVDVQVPRIDSCYYFEYMNASQILNNAVLAEKQGCAAFAVTCMRSPVYIEAQEIVDIPVVYIKECALSFSLMYAKKFAFISYADGPLIRRAEETRRIGFTDRLLPGGSIGVSLEEVAKSFDDPDPILRSVQEVSKKAVKEGAELLIPACNCLSVLLAERGLREVEGIPILDNTTLLVKMTETMVDLKTLGTYRTRAGLFPSPSKEERTKVRRLFGLE